MGTGACFRSLDNAADGANTACLGFRAGGSGVMMLMISISYRRLATLCNQSLAGELCDYSVGRRVFYEPTKRVAYPVSCYRAEALHC
jgi:hypothetical protein